MNKTTVLLVAAGFWCGLVGCGQTFGGLLYHLNLVQPPKIHAQFVLAKGPLLIVVDDNDEVLQWPSIQDLLVDKIGQTLLKEEVNSQVLTSQQINQIKQRDKDFDKRSISELGKVFAVEQIIWIQIRDFFASARFEDTNNTARFIVRVKVFDPHAETKREMRLWPDKREGKFVTVEKNVIELQSLETDEEIRRLLAVEMAEQLAKLFYKHAPEEP